MNSVWCRATFFILVLGLSGCAATATLRGGLAAAEKRLEQIEANGAYVCAPKELALAKAHIEFARLEISQGMGSRAKAHYDIAMQNLELADKKSPPDKCATPAVVVAEPLPPECNDQDGDYICADVDKCPQQAEDFDGIEDEDGCPEDQDTDGDGILDSVDMCVVDAEDKDGYQDEDGCPDLDNDADTILDSVDTCPMTPEDPDGYQDEDGCPDEDNDGDKILDVDDECPNEAGIESEKGCPKKYEGVQITETRIEINQKIFFAYNKAKIMKKSYAILATVAEVLNDNPEITLSIEGHTDSRGKDAYNKRLSTKRAKAVMDHLVKKGKVDKNRLTSVGWGEEKPIDSNQTDEGRAANRRVEFVRTDNTD
ncbi:MAG: OmpA family protein [Deltaproteobacteria bacterium]|nr:OmpA family protein [Deltaproteobacteria bacterium]MBN2673442.1 OmpA family protein [Deltaproteobacteria bacterium]